ncbi:MAG TPA: hypothetical protein ENK88_06065 [Campylobacterales bacterium]|nr:hypothetical protein [Campylobacterales bacterium]
MIFQSIIKFIPALLYSIAFLGLFYWQFLSVYDFIIHNFTQSKLFVLFGYLFIYIFFISIVATSTINILQKYLIKAKTFVIITVITLLIFYILSFDDFYHIIDYFIQFPLSSTAIMGMIFFIILSLGYALYSLGILYFRDSIPISHILIFLFLGVIYSVGFIHIYCMPLF